MVEFHGQGFDSAGPGEVYVVSDSGDEIIEELPLRTDLKNHSPSGFAVGYNGSGPAQLALAILAYLYTDEEAMDAYQEFKRLVIADIESDRFRLTESVVRDWYNATQ